MPSVRQRLTLVPPSILVMDDDKDLLNVMELTIVRICRRSVTKVASLADLQRHQTEALRCIAAILDINLGENQPSGLEVYRWLRKNRFVGTIFFLTGHAKSHPLVKQACQLGDATVLAKPISAQSLVQLVEDLR